VSDFKERTASEFQVNGIRVSDSDPSRRAARAWAGSESTGQVTGPSRWPLPGSAGLAGPAPAGGPAGLAGGRPGAAHELSPSLLLLGLSRPAASDSDRHGDRQPESLTVTACQSVTSLVSPAGDSPGAAAASGRVLVVTVVHWQVQVYTQG
jgi:hypothetical protein